MMPAGLQGALSGGRPVATGLANPRAMLRLDDSSLLVATAGTGQPTSGALLILTDIDGDGSYDGQDERRPLLKDAPSVNIAGHDEILGMSALARGDGRILAAIAFPNRPSVLWSIAASLAEPWATVEGNINDLVFDDKRETWFAVSSSKGELLRIDSGGHSELLTRFAGHIAHIEMDRDQDRLLVSLSAGSTEDQGRGGGNSSGSGKIMSIDPNTGKAWPLVTGLTAPTDLALYDDNRLLVLERCGAICRRFSGRLIEIDLARQSFRLLADGLDTPTNMLLDRGTVLVAQGMGAAGRLDGFIEAFDGPF